MKHSYQTIEDNVSLRPLEESDALLMRVLRNQKKHCFLTQYEISEEQQIAWYHNYLSKENDYMFAVGSADHPDLFIGAVAVYDIKNGVAEVGRVIIDKNHYPQKGLGGSAVKAACRIGFADLKLELIYAKVLVENIASLTMFRKLGFIETGEKDGCIHFEMRKEHFERLNGSKC